MFRVFLLFAVALVFLQEATGQSIEERRLWEFEKWPEMFKDRAFCLCLEYGYRDSIIKSAFQKDKSFYNPVAIAVFDAALKPVVLDEVRQIDGKERVSYSRVSEAAAGRRVLDHCLDFYKSKRLDSLMRTAKPSWSKINDIGARIRDSIPTF